MSSKKRGIMLKSLTPEDEGMQELINPVPLELIIDEDEDFEMSIEIDEIVAAEDEAVRDVLEMLEDTAQILDTRNSGKA
jgi:spore coat polysaccharide biosynthesis protein SpsF (cytidylyltransferase family)